MRAGGIIRILTITNGVPWQTEEWHRLCSLLPDAVRDSSRSYVNWQDRQATVLGRLLLRHGLLSWGLGLQSICLDANGRPFLSDAMDIDFNISHTEGIVVCALREGGRVGIDVESVQSLESFDYRLVFTETECCLMEDSADAANLFFNFWTRKEALIKADGRGFFLNPLTFEVFEDTILIGEKTWYLEKISLGDGYLCHLALDSPGYYCVEKLAIEKFLNQLQ